MRIIAGTARGRRLVAPAGNTVRPTSDRVREATFNALDSRAVIKEARVLDLFAGSGALGIEALSRGAAHCTFVEKDRLAVDAIRANLDAIGFADRATVVPADVLRFTRSPVRNIDLALVDPPYTFEGWDSVLLALAAVDLVMLETRAPVDAPGWEILRRQRYGGTVVTLITRQENPA